MKDGLLTVINVRTAHLSSRRRRQDRRLGTLSSKALNRSDHETRTAQRIRIEVENSGVHLAAEISVGRGVVADWHAGPFDAGGRVGADERRLEG